MKSQIDAITRYVEMGYRAFTGQIEASVYERLNCPEPFFSKWLYQKGIHGKKAVCVGCSRECTVDNLEGFILKDDYFGVFDWKKPYAITPNEMIKRHTLLTASQAAYCLNISVRTVYNLIAEGKLTKLKERPVRVRSIDVACLMNDFDE